MKVTLNVKMVMGILNAWAKRNLEGEGLVINAYAFENNELVITFKTEEPAEEIIVED